MEIESKLAENIHDYLDEIREMVEVCDARPKFPIQAIQARSLILQELPKMIESVEVLSQALVKAVKSCPDASLKLELIRGLERVNFLMVEELPRLNKALDPQ